MSQYIGASSRICKGNVKGKCQKCQCRARLNAGIAGGGCMAQVVFWVHGLRSCSNGACSDVGQALMAGAVSASAAGAPIS